MNCELAQERIVTAAYGELTDDLVHELERHLTGCPECQAERNTLLDLQIAAEAFPVLEPNANLVARSRIRLEEALDALPPLRWHERLGQMVRNNFAGMSAVPLAASALLVAGAALGSLGGYQIALHHARQTNTATVTAPTMSAEAQTASATTAATSVNSAEIASVSSVVRQPHNGLVEIHYNRLVPQTMQGSIDDPAIQKLLSTASRNKESNNARSESVNLLATECRSGHACQTADVRDSLMVALRYDTRASVREKALQGLERYISQDVRVRDAVLGALMNDPSPRVRTAAVSLLEPVEGDTSVRQVLHSVADSDQNPYIRTVSRQVLNQVPEIQ